MTIPSFQEFMNPVLRVFAESKKEAKNTEIENKVADILGLSDNDRLEVISSREETVLHNRTMWASYYMMRAGLLESPKRGIYKITEEGLKVFKSNQKVDVKFLMNYPSFVAFKNSNNVKNNTKTNESKQIKESLLEVEEPETRISKALTEINNILEEDLLNTLKKVEPIRFERIVVDLMEAMKYGIGEVTRYVGDGGIDGIISEDELGLDKIYLQAKRYSDGRVNEKEMRDFVGALETKPVGKGVFITTSFFSEKADNLAKSSKHHNIRLINGKELVSLMIKYNLGVKIKKGYEVKEIDGSFFEE